MSKHTIGPWTFREAFNNGEPCGFAIEAGRTPIADVATLDADDYEIDKGNSRLIAASPELLEALISCVTEDGARCMTDESRNAASICRRRLDAINRTAIAAIAKARGEAVAK